MIQPKEILISDYSYLLPQSSIAVYPPESRDASKLLTYKEGIIAESTYSSLADYLPPESLLLFNNTKVAAARLLFTKHTGSAIELFCLEPADEYKDITAGMLQRQSVRWKCLAGGAKKWKAGVLQRTSRYKGQEIILTAAKVEKKSDYFLIAFNWNIATVSFAEILNIFGEMPLPPYLNRAADEKDKERYQTVYARHDGSVAAPTAGLHFTDAVFAKLQAKNIDTDFVTLHVGAGTFKPVKAAAIAGHDMHAEYMEVTASLIEKLIQKTASTIIAVGTTSLRTIESLYWMGVKVLLNEKLLPEDINLLQWEAYELPQDIPVIKALQALLYWMSKNSIAILTAKTKILIAPGYKLRIITALITNFHQPQSTLLLLIAALVGDDWKKIYDYALAHDFRFLSYGDGCLLWNKMF